MFFLLAELAKGAGNEVWGTGVQSQPDVSLTLCHVSQSLFSCRTVQQFFHPPSPQRVIA